MTILYVILSLRVSFLFPLPVYYILQSVISYLMNLHIYGSLAILTIMPAASHGFLSIRSRYFWLTALWCMWHTDQFVRDSTDRLECYKFSLFCSLWFIKGNREWSAISFKLGCTITGRAELKGYRISCCLNVAFSWLGVYLVAVDVWLISRAPIQLFYSMSRCYF